MPTPPEAVCINISLWIKERNTEKELHEGLTATDMTSSVCVALI